MSNPENEQQGGMSRNAESADGQAPGQLGQESQQNGASANAFQQQAADGVQPVSQVPAGQQTPQGINGQQATNPSMGAQIPAMGGQQPMGQNQAAPQGNNPGFNPNAAAQQAPNAGFDPNAQVPQGAGYAQNVPQGAAYAQNMAPNGAYGAPAAAPAQSQKTSVVGIIAVVLGVLALLLCWIPLVDIASIVMAIAGIVLTVIGFVNISKGKSGGKVLNAVAVALNVVALLVSCIMLISFNRTAHQAADAISSAQSSTSGSHHSDSDHDDYGTSRHKTKPQQGEGDIDGAHVKIVSAVQGPQDDDGNPTVIVTYNWTNKGKENADFSLAVQDEVFQNGRQLETTYFYDDVPGYDDSSDTTQLQPGASGNVTIAYKMKDTSPVTVDLTGFMSREGKVTQTFKF